MYVDFHNDTVLKIVYGGEDFRRGSPSLHVDLRKILSLEKPLTLFFAAWVDPVFEGEQALLQALALLRRIRGIVSDCPEHLRIAGNMKDAEESVRSGRTSVVLAVEGGQAINNDAGNIDRLREAGVRLMTLSHLESPRWVGSSHGGADRGLDSLGRDVVGAMNRAGMIVDVAHASERSIRDAARTSAHPIVSSHSCAKGVFDTERGLSDDAIRTIAATGGVIGVMFFPGQLTEVDAGKGGSLEWIMEEFARINRDPGLTPEEKAQMKLPLVAEKYPRPERLPGVEAVFRQIDYMLRIAGEDHVGIGSDFDGIPYGCSDLEDIGKLGTLVDLMRRSGYSEERVAKIMGANAARVMREVMG
ncbi:MAG: membrane dipeptidase [Candidatus Eisenbacteria bacterium]